MKSNTQPSARQKVDQSIPLNNNPSNNNIHLIPSNNNIHMIPSNNNIHLIPSNKTKDKLKIFIDNEIEHFKKTVNSNSLGEWTFSQAISILNAFSIRTDIPQSKKISALGYGLWKYRATYPLLRSSSLFGWYSKSFESNRVEFLRNFAPIIRYILDREMDLTIKYIGYPSTL
jgi:hypothetical protein